MPFQKGHVGFKKKGTKHKLTLLKEERRARFDQKISQKWDKIINKLKPEYIADQFMGKAPEKMDHNINWKPFDELPENNSIQENKGT